MYATYLNVNGHVLVLTLMLIATAVGCKIRLFMSIAGSFRPFNTDLEHLPL